MDMGFSDLPTDSLLEQRQQLDSAAVQATARGEVPSELLTQLLQVEEELKRRGVQSAASDCWAQLHGQCIDGYTLEQLLSSSAHAFTFKATNHSTSDQAVIKIARRTRVASNRPFTSSMAYYHRTITGFEPAAQLSGNEILSSQAQRLNSAKDAALLKVKQMGMHDERFFYRLPYIDGQTMHELIGMGKVPLQVYLPRIFHEISGALSRLSASGFRHGNLSAEHVLLHRGGLVFLSPGEHPKLCDFNSQAPIVTTPAYYPWLDADDIRALGILLWESLTFKHPCDCDNAEDQTERLDDEVLERIELERECGNATIGTWKRMRLPRDQSAEISEGKQQLILKAVGFQLDDHGHLQLGAPLATYGEFRTLLRQLTLE